MSWLRTAPAVPYCLMITDATPRKFDYGPGVQVPLDGLLSESQLRAIGVSSLQTGGVAVVKSFGFAGMELKVVFVEGASKELGHFFEAVEAAFEEDIGSVEAAGVELVAVGVGGHGSQAGQGEEDDGVAAH
ncbi:hypothetical protein MMC27_000583, partial [Xylographa pallens]|nr:hypothetical protein [Xylographa pallens]